MNAQVKILIVDDDPNILEVLDARLTAANFHVCRASDGPSAIQILKKTPVDLMISDMKMPAMNGMDLFSKVKQTLPELPVIFLTAHGTIPDAVTALKNGAVDYISKPFDGIQLIKKINEILTINKSAFEDYESSSIKDGFYWGTSTAMKELYRTIKKVAATNVNVLILGESGVGKECIAKFIHKYSAQKKNPYIVVDCGSTPSGILESELFGHLKGSFTHAIKDKQGLIEAANRGTLFLDEIGNISQDMQKRLLRFIEDKKIRRVGAIKEKTVDCRILSATNANLNDYIDKGIFRQDLYYRLKVVTLNIPALRERREDIPMLSHFFIDKYIKKHNLPKITLSDNTMQLLKNHPWPGNIRELKNSLEAGVVLCKTNRIQPSDLQLENTFEKNGKITSTKSDFSIENSEKNTIIRALQQANGIQKDAAELMDISKRSIHYKIKKFNIKTSDYKH